MSIGHGFRASFLASAILASTFVMMGCLPEIDPAATDSTGEDLFATNCAVCHGTTGSGDGPAASSLPTQPPNLTKIAERRDGIWPMLEVMSILDGYTKRTNSREGMPIIPSLTDGPIVDFDPGNGIVVPTPARLIALVNYIETIQSPPPERYVP